MKVECPHCEGEIELSDDPRLTQIVDAMTQQQKTLERYADKIEALSGKRPDVPVADVPGVSVRRKKGDTVYEGIFVSYVLDEDETDDSAKG